MIFNGISKEFLQVVRGVERKVIAPIEHHIRPNRKYGGRITRTQLRVLELTVPVFLTRPVGTTWEQVKMEISGWLQHPEDKTLAFKSTKNTGSPHHYNARLNSIDLPSEDYDHLEGVITFICQDPFRFSDEVKRNLPAGNNDPFNIDAHVEMPWKTKTIFTEASSTFSLQYLGKVGSELETVLLNYNFISGDSLEIDSYRRKVTLNGKNLAVSLSLSSNWFLLMPGDNSIKASHKSELSYFRRYY